MPADLSKSLVIGVSSRALFNLEEENAIFEAEGEAAYTAHLRGREKIPLQPGTGFRLVQAILNLNHQVAESQEKRGIKRNYRPCEVVIMSKNSPATSYCLFNSIEHHKLDIQRAVLSGGRQLSPYVKPFSIDLYLSAYEDDVQSVMDAEIAAAVIYGSPEKTADPEEEIRIAFDGDAVLFSDEAEQIYQSDGVERFLEHEQQKAQQPLPKGPFARLLKTLSELQKDEIFEKPPIRTALVTARNMPAHLRVLNTFRAWDVHVDEAFFMGGIKKDEILEAFNPHIFFDDQKTHCDSAAKVVPTSRVLSSQKKSVMGKKKRPRKATKKSTNRNEKNK